MATAGWQPTVESYFGRVTKGRIVDAVREAKGEEAAQRIAHLKKAEMATAAEELLAGTAWVPEPLRTPGQSFTPGTEPAVGADTDKGRKDPSGQAGPPQAVAAE
jgi:ParB family chromosome partitioning protein